MHSWAPIAACSLATMAYGTMPVGFSWALQSSDGNLALQRHTKIGDVSVDDEGCMHVIAADWLRERCSSPSCIDMDSQQPLHDPHLIDAVRVVDVHYVESFASHNVRNVSRPHAWGKAPTNMNALHIVFSDNTASNFGVGYLLSEIEDHGPTPMQGLRVDLPPVSAWDHTLVAPEVFLHPLGPAQEFQLVQQLLSVGIAIIDNVPRTEGFCTKFGSTISTVRETEWGRQFNVRTVPDLGQDVVKKDLAYTSKSIGLHTDNPYRDPMPDIQLLHQIDGCFCPGDSYPCEACGTENTFSDGAAVAAKLFEEDPAAFNILSTTSVRWENNGGDGKAMMMVYKPIIEVDYSRMVDGKCRLFGVNAATCLEGDALNESSEHEAARANGSSASHHRSSADIIDCVKAVRHSAKSGGYAPLLPPDIAQKFYAARRKFSAMLAAPENLIYYYLKPGQLIIFDNKRVLHSRSTVISDKPRWLQGCYINRDGLYYRFSKTQLMEGTGKESSGASM